MFQYYPITICHFSVLGSIYAARPKNPERGGYTLFGATQFPGFSPPDIYVYSGQELIDRFPQHRDLIEELVTL